MKDALIPFWTLFTKETIRFLKVWKHTIFAPVLTSFLYLVVFGEALEKHLPVYAGVSYTNFIVPGLIMMTVLQNAFSNTASSLLQSKISAMAGAGVYIVCMGWAAPPVANPCYLVAFAFSGVIIMASLGLSTALWAEKYDQMGAVMNFVVMPLTFLSGVFYSVDSLPEVWRDLSLFNTFFYLVAGFRQGFFGTGTTNAALSLVIVGVTAFATAAAAVTLMTRGWKIRA